MLAVAAGGGGGAALPSGNSRAACRTALTAAALHPFRITPAAFEQDND